MKLIIAGSRSIRHFPTLLEAISLSPYQSLITEIVSGNTQGVDMLGEQYARKMGIHLAIFPARWSELGRSAGFTRNLEMAAYADSLLALWSGSSKGTANMIDTMKRTGKPYFVYCPEQGVSFNGNLQHLVSFTIVR